VGSPNSSNSNRLREIAEKLGTPAYLIDGAEDIREEWLAEGPRVGVTAVASAPDLLVDRVIKRLTESGATGVEEQSGIREQVVFALPRELAQKGQTAHDE
jgi:4-hydroxy-3-methylbut-2-enyl diphosphate reductase